MNVSISIDFSQLKTAIAQCNLEEKLELLHLLETSQELEPAIASFRRGWDDVINGRTKPIAELWDGIDHVKMQVTETIPNSSQGAIAENLISTF